MLGVCNGFQILTEAGLLPGALIRNAGLRFVCRSVELEVATRASPFTARLRPTAPIRLPVAHHDGNYVIDADGLQRLEDEDRIAFRYLDNPNGSTADIAGVLGARRNVLGLMPHPERAIEPAARRQRRPAAVPLPARGPGMSDAITPEHRRRARPHARRVRAHPARSSAARRTWSSSASSR